MTLTKAELADMLFEKVGLNTIGGSSAEFRPHLAASIKRFAEAVKLAGVEPE